MPQDPDVRTYSNGKGQAPTIIFVSVLAVAMTAASGLACLLPWPPSPGDAIFFAIVATLCLGFAGGVAWFGLRESEIRIDRGKGEVTQWVKFLGREKTHRWPLHEFHTVEVRNVKLRDRNHEARSGNQSFRNGPDRIFVVYLNGPTRLRLQDWTQPSPADDHAVELALFGGWQTKLASAEPSR